MELRNNKILHLITILFYLKSLGNKEPILKDHLNYSKAISKPSWPFEQSLLSFEESRSALSSFVLLSANTENCLPVPKCTMFHVLALHLFFPFLNSFQIPQTALLPSAYKKSYEALKILSSVPFLLFLWNLSIHPLPTELIYSHSTPNTGLYDLDEL